LPRPGRLYYSVLFHELGHAIHALSCRGPSHLFRYPDGQYGFNGLNESVGGLFEDLGAEPAWLIGGHGMRPPDAARTRADLLPSFAADFAGHVAHVRAEIELYRRPSADVGRAKWGYLERLLGYDTFEPPAWPDFFLVESPVYVQSYLIAALFAAQVRAAGLAEVGGEVWPNPRFGPWLTRTWLRPGTRYDWMSRVEEVTGQRLGPRALLRHLAE
ncbi:MAG: hypothetical protein L3J91_04825, partial [Thermoplasmata archaeon]|nr:hypothetical protein [Thermoplasmata archaeon]